MHIEVIVYFPRFKKGKEGLAKRVAAVHAQMVLESVSRLDCPTYQNIDNLLDMVYLVLCRESYLPEDMKSGLV